MHVLMYSWEFPPLVIGGIARHVHDLSLSLTRQGVDVTVVTAGPAGSQAEERHGRLRIYRVFPTNPRPLEIASQVMRLNNDLLERTLALVAGGESFDLVHVHDWVTAFAGKAAKHGLGLPLFATVHATEYGRNGGLHNDLQRYISDVEWWLCFEAWRVISCSRYMSDELRRVFQIPGDKLRLIPNGVYPEEFAAGSVPPGFREQYAASKEKILFYVGRLVREKGLDILLDAFARLVAEHRLQAKLIIAGRGGYESFLKDKARRLGIFRHVYFTGYIDDRTRNLLYRLADAAVFPSLYEPFGIVALEAMAAGAPVIVSDTGGMSEIIDHGVNGLKAQTGNPVSLAENLAWLMDHPEQAINIRLRALEDVRRLYDWNRIAAMTVQAYQEVLAEAGGGRRGAWKPSPQILAEDGLRGESYDRYSQVNT